MTANTLYFGDNLISLRQFIPDETVDLIYLDPPYFTNRTYHILSGNARGEKAYNDQWQSNQTTESGKANKEFDRIIEGFRSIVGDSALLNYLRMITPRLIELRRVLKSTGSIYLHCDQHASAALKIMLDALFGCNNFLNQIVWCYGLGGSTPRRWPRKHDDILWYSKSVGKHFFSPEMIPATSLKMKGQMKKAPDYWLLPTVNNMARERCGYPTQKPLALMERIISTSSRPNDVVLDPFAGSGTSLIASTNLNRRWIGMENSPVALQITQERLKDISSEFQVIYLRDSQ
jgi:DNA modification methylase